MLINLNFLLFNKRVEDSIAITRLMVLMTRRLRIKQMICEPLLLNAASPQLEITLTVFQFVLFITFSVVFSFNLGYFSFNLGKK